MKLAKKIIIGTAQFGNSYGISNSKGQVKIKEVKNILKFAKQNKIKSFDTAISYGDSEKILGNYKLENYKVISKINKTSLTNINKDYIFHQISQILERLKINKLYGILIHDPNILYSKQGKQLVNYLNECKEYGLVEKVGVSVTNVIDIKTFLNQFTFDIVQAPFNIFDRRLVQLNLIEYMKKKNIELHVRSIFLQGLLLMSYDKIPKKFQKWNKLFKKWEDWVIYNNISKIEACVSFAYLTKDISNILIGCQSVKELKEILNINPSNNLKIPEDLICDDLDLINPTEWS